MARRKGYVDDGYSSDSASASSSASQVEGWQRKRKRKGTKEDAIYRIFGSGSEGENERQGGAGRTVKSKDRNGRKVDFLKGQSFVPASRAIEREDPNKDSSSDSSGGEEEQEQEGDAKDDDDDDDDDDDSMSEAERIAREPATDVEELETRNPFALGPTKEAAMAKDQDNNPDGFRPSTFTSSRAGIGTSGVQNNGERDRQGLGSIPSTSNYPTFTRGGIGSSNQVEAQIGAPSFAKSAFVKGDSTAQHASIQASKLSDVGIPSTFGAAIAPSNAFTQRKSTQQNATRPSSFATPPSTSIKFGGGTGGKFDPSKYLAQMGWTGGGLGKQGEGIVNPIEVKQRPERAGIAFGGIKEKTKQAKEEARRRGEDVSTDEDEREKRQRSEKKSTKTKAKEARGPQVWTRTEKKIRKPKMEHRTYEEILEEHGQGSVATSAGLGQILDAAGNEFTSISAALAKHSVPTSESTQLIEIRHNLRLICEANQKELQSLAKEGASILEKHKWLLRDRDESQRRILREEKEAKRLRDILSLVTQIENLGKQSETDPIAQLSSFDTLVEQIIARYNDVIADLRLDEAIVGAIIPTLRKHWAKWKPLEMPGLAIDHFSKWRQALRVDVKSDIMTPYETLIWNLWMPPVRSALNNDWDPYEPMAAVTLYQSWKTLLPSFIVDNLSQQLIIPKLSRATMEWDAKAPLHRVIFPWIGLLGQQMNEVVAEAKRRLRSSLKSWRVSKGVPADLSIWKEAKVFTSNEWNSMMLDNVIPKISSHLDSQLVIDPQSQDTRPLEALLLWKPLLATKILSKVLQAKFVPKWLHTLHSWLVDSRANLEEVAKWYEHWKSWFEKQNLLDLTSLQEAFQIALQLMSRAMELGQERTRLLFPNLKEMHLAATSTSTSTSAQLGRFEVRAQPTIINEEEGTATSFRQIVEEAIMEADLIMQSLNQKEIHSQRPLYRVSKHLDGRGGISLYMDQDVVFVERKKGDGSSRYEPISIKDLIKLVT